MKTELNVKKHNSAETADDRLNWRYQDKAYNESFKQWRKQKQDSIGFYFVENPNQLTYQDKVGFIRDYPEARETKAFQKVLTVLGIVLIYRVLFDTFSFFVLPALLEKLGFDIHHSFFTGQRFGDETLIITVDLITQLLGRIIPIYVLIKHLEMPVSVMIPTKITNKPMFRFSIPATLLTAGSCCVMSYFYEEILNTCHISSARTLMIPEHTNDFIYVLIVHVLVVPIVSELCVHGVILQLTRQFGDGTALCITSLIIAASTYDITQFLFAAVTSFVIGYFTIRTGSVITAIIMKCTLRAYIYTLYFLDYNTDPAYSSALVRAFLFLTITIGVLTTIHFLYTCSDKFGITLKSRYMTPSAKILSAASCIPIIIWFTLNFLVTIINLNFTV